MPSILSLFRNPLPVLLVEILPVPLQFRRHRSGSNVFVVHRIRLLHTVAVLLAVCVLHSPSATVGIPQHPLTNSFPFCFRHWLGSSSSYSRHNHLPLERQPGA